MGRQCRWLLLGENQLGIPETVLPLEFHLIPNVRENEQVLIRPQDSRFYNYFFGEMVLACGMFVALLLFHVLDETIFVNELLVGFDLS